MSSRPSFAEELAAAWPEDAELEPADVEAVENLAAAIHRLAETLGPLRAGWLLVMVGRKLGGAE